jgi:hypothetical protein
MSAVRPLRQSGLYVGCAPFLGLLAVFLTSSRFETKLQVTRGTEREWTGTNRQLRLHIAW